LSLSALLPRGYVRHAGRRLKTLTSIVTHIMPTSEIDIHTSEPTVSNGDGTLAIEAGDWLTLPDDQLVARLIGLSPSQFEAEEGMKLTEQFSPLEIVTREDGLPLARIGLLTELSVAGYGWPRSDLSAIMAGPANTRCGVHGVAGVFLGRATRAARDDALPIMEPHHLSQWATTTAPRVIDPDVNIGSETLHELADAIDELGADVPYARRWRTSRGWLDRSGLLAMVSRTDDMFVVHPIYADIRSGHELTPIDLIDNVVVFEIGRRLAMQAEYGWPFPVHDVFERYGSVGELISVIAEAWTLDRRVLERVFRGREREGMAVGSHAGVEVRGSALHLSRPNLSDHSGPTD
jgi:hypothetical protein